MATLTCRIQWIDAQGQPTPDNNPAVAMVRSSNAENIRRFPHANLKPSQWFPCCAEHLAQLSLPDMHEWEQRPLEKEGS